MLRIFTGRFRRRGGGKLHLMKQEEELNPTGRLSFPMLPEQLRRLHALWQEWAGGLKLAPEQDRALRHYYVGLFAGGEVTRTRELDSEGADRVIAWLDGLARQAKPRRKRRAAGTAGRRGYPEQKRIHPDAAAWGALWAHARTLGMNQERLERFIAERYSGVGLRGLDDLRTMADLNRVLWGLKAMLRRAQRAKRERKVA